MATASEFVNRKRAAWKQKELPSEEQDELLLAGVDLLSMAKDALDTGKRYKSRHHVWRDALQAWHGLKNLLLAVGATVGFLLALVLGIIAEPFWNLIRGNYAKSYRLFKNALYDTTTYLARSITLALRGITQIATAPLTWLRMIGRGIYTAITGWQPFTENPGTKRLVDDATTVFTQKRNNRADTAEICELLERKLKKAVSQGQPIDLDLRFNDEICPMTMDLEYGVTAPEANKIYIKITEPGSFWYMTTATGKGTSVQILVSELGLVGLEGIPLDLNDIKQHKDLVFKAIYQRGDAHPVENFKQVRDPLWKYFADADREDSDNNYLYNDPAALQFNAAGKILAKDYLNLFGASLPSAPVAPAPAGKSRVSCQWSPEYTAQALKP